MKKGAILFISLYQTLASSAIKNILGVKSMCRYNPSCSQYAKQSIKRYGMLKGGILGLKRILSCQPFQPFYYGRYF